MVPTERLESVIGYTPTIGKKALHLLLVLDIIAYSLKNKSDQSVIIGKEQKKVIISEIANGVMITVLNTFEIVCNVFQKPISGLLSIPVIEQLEMLQINGGDAPVFWRVLVESDTYLLKKTVSGNAGRSADPVSV